MGDVYIFCSYCGKQIKEGARTCINCGYNLDNPLNIDFCYIILGFLFPLFGIIFYFILRKENLISAKNCIYSSVVSISISYINSTIFINIWIFNYFYIIVKNILKIIRKCIIIR